MSKSGIVLVTGATGKVGRVFIQRLLADPKFGSFTIRALCHNRELEPHERIQNIHGSIEHRRGCRKGAGRRDTCRPSGNLQRNSRPDHGCSCQRIVLAA